MLNDLFVIILLLNFRPLIPFTATFSANLYIFLQNSPFSNILHVHDMTTTPKSAGVVTPRPRIDAYGLVFHVPHSFLSSAFLFNSASDELMSSPRLPVSPSDVNVLIAMS